MSPPGPRSLIGNDPVRLEQLMNEAFGRTIPGVTSDVVVIKSDVIVQGSDLKLVSDALVVVASDLVLVSDALVAVASDLVLVYSDTTAIHSDTTQMQLGIIYGATAAGTLTTTQCTTNLTGYLDDEIIGRLLVFTSGTADGQAATITDYASSTGLITYAAGITTAPAASDGIKVT